ncbi:MAG: hypothetical protein IJ770_03140 [Alphaproteobacteria bacterium]|nr:hypothetical protein [Alphaproteobacteria bacterium]
MKDFKGIIALNSDNQNDMIAWFCIENSEIGRLKQLLRDGMPLSAFMLTSMVFFGYSDAVIKEVLLLAEVYDSDDVPRWIQGYFEDADLAAILPEFQDGLPSDWPSDEDCVRFELWQVLKNRKRFDLIAQNAPQIAEEMELYPSLLKVDFAKYAPFCLAKKWYFDIVQHQDGWKYLIDQGLADWVLERGSFCGLLPRAEIEEYCLQKGLIDELYNSRRYNILLEHQQFDVFVKNHSFHPKFLTEYPDKVDWEDLWTHCSDKENQKYLKEQAFKNRHISQCSEFLLAHSGLLGQIRLFLN